MNTFWICAHLIAFALGVATYSIARRGWKKAREFAKGPIPMPAPSPPLPAQRRPTVDNLETLIDELIVAAKHAGWAYGSRSAQVAAAEAKDRLITALRQELTNEPTPKR